MAVDDYRGRNPVLIGMFRGLHCPFCRRHIAAMSQLDPALREKGIESLTVVNTPIERARLYFRYRPMPDYAGRSRPRARVAPRLRPAQSRRFTDDETAWPRKVAMSQMMAMKINMPASCHEPMNPIAARAASSTRWTATRSPRPTSR